MLAFERLPLRTQRLLLRPLAAADAHDVFAVYSDPVVMRYWSTPPWTRIEQAHEMIAGDIAGFEGGEHLRLALLPADGTAPLPLLGTCSLWNIDRSSRRAEVGYLLAATAWGRGYMHEAMTALVRYAFEDQGLNRLEADIDPRNQPSEKSLLRLGFQKEGHLRERWIVNGEVSDSGLYGLLARDWRACSSSGPQ